MFDDLFERTIDDLRGEEREIVPVESEDGNWDTGQVWSTGQVPNDVWTPN